MKTYIIGYRGEIEVRAESEKKARQIMESHLETFSKTVATININN